MADRLAKARRAGRQSSLCSLCEQRDLPELHVSCCPVRDMGLPHLPLPQIS